jgi:tRNA dimethylallyltransferase
MIRDQKIVWVVCGPTASGKTRLAIDLARKRNAEILSFDSRQLYREMNIGVARPSDAELAEVPHHFIASHTIAELYTAGQFAREARAFLENYFQQKNEVVLCGGTGLYLDALLKGMDRQPVPENIRQSVRDLYEQDGLEGLQSAIKSEDDTNSPDLEWQNPNRLIRYLEWIRAGRPASEPVPLPAGWTIRKIGPQVERSVLYERINQRVELMIKAGLWEEAQSLFSKKELTALQTVGYQEIFDCLQGVWNRETAIDKIKQHTRNYAKRQITWFKRDPEVTWLKPEDQAAWLASLDSQGS